MQEAAAEAGARAQGFESAEEVTDRSNPPPHQRQEQAEEVANPGAAAQSSQPVVEQVVVEGDHGGERSCDVYKGRWLYDEANAPLYKESECEFLTEQVTCMRNGRRDDDYQKWRWQPDGCDLPRYKHHHTCSACFP